MPSFADITERLASAALLAAPNDLPALARLHEELSAVPQQLAGDATLSAAATERLVGTAGAATKLVEQIMLREVTGGIL